MGPGVHGYGSFWGSKGVRAILVNYGLAKAILQKCVLFLNEHFQNKGEQILGFIYFASFFVL